MQKIKKLYVKILVILIIEIFPCNKFRVMKISVLRDVLVRDTATTS
jgi:hypothetical protein